jgi:hypothetical protein
MHKVLSHYYGHCNMCVLNTDADITVPRNTVAKKGPGKRPRVRPRYMMLASPSFRGSADADTDETGRLSRNEDRELCHRRTGAVWLGGVGTS